jgi:Xaa-Pro aminopeptidase
MAWDADEVPAAALRARVARLQAAIGERGLDAILLYTNFVRSAAVSYLTGFSPYWADGVLLVPREGEPIFATTLSKRVGSWIETVKPIGTLVNSPTPVKVLGNRLTEARAKRLAVLELDAFPSGLYDELTSALPSAEIVEGGEVFAAARLCDDVERRLLARAEAIARRAVAQASGNETSAGEVAARIEKHARETGAEEIYIAIAPDLERDRTFLRLSGAHALQPRFAVRASTAYKGAWVRCTRTYARDDGDKKAIARADAWFETILATADITQLFQQLAAPLPNAPVLDWIAETPLGTRPLSVVASMKQPQGALQASPLVLSVAVDVDGVTWCGGGLAAQ